MQSVCLEEVAICAVSDVGQSEKGFAVFAGVGETVVVEKLLRIPVRKGFLEFRSKFPVARIRAKVGLEAGGSGGRAGVGDANVQAWE
jgi:hypothetical protein